MSDRKFKMSADKQYLFHSFFMGKLMGADKHNPNSINLSEFSDEIPPFNKIRFYTSQYNYTPKKLSDISSIFQILCNIPTISRKKEKSFKDINKLTLQRNKFSDLHKTILIKV